MENQLKTIEQNIWKIENYIKKLDLRKAENKDLERLKLSVDREEIGKMFRDVQSYVDWAINDIKTNILSGKASL